MNKYWLYSQAGARQVQLGARIFLHACPHPALTSHPPASTMRMSFSCRMISDRRPSTRPLRERPTTLRGREMMHRMFVLAQAKTEDAEAVRGVILTFKHPALPLPWASPHTQALLQAGSGQALADDVGAGGHADLQQLVEASGAVLGVQLGGGGVELVVEAHQLQAQLLGVELNLGREGVEGRAREGWRVWEREQGWRQEEGRSGGQADGTHALVGNFCLKPRQPTLSSSPAT